MKNSNKTTKTKKTTNFGIILRVFSDMKQIRWLIVAIVLISVAGVGISLATPSILGSLTDALYNLWAHGTPINAGDFTLKGWLLAGIYALSAILGVISMIINNNAV